MEKRNAVHAVYAESLVFETNFGLAQVQATPASSEVAKPAQFIAAWSAAALAAENITTEDTTASPVIH